MSAGGAPAGACRRGVGAWLAVGFVLAVGLVVVLGVLAGTGPYSAVGSGDPGAAVRIGTPVLRLVGDLAATLCTGGLAFAAFFTTPVASGLISADGYAALRNAGRWATVWSLTAAALVPVEAANTAGLPLPEVTGPDALPALVSAMEGPKAWLLVAAVALVVALGCRASLRWQPVVGLLVLAVFALLPPLATGHASSEAGHDVATAALMVHVPTAAIWIGVLFALIMHLRRGGRLHARLAHRYSHLATTCWLALAVSGVITSWRLVPLDELATTSYGLVLIANVVLLVALGLVAVPLRRGALRAIDRTAGRGPLTRLAAGEFAVLLVSLGVSAGLTHLVPTELVGRAVTEQETLLGYNLAGPPTLQALLADWRIDVFFALLAIVLATVYLGGVYRLRRQGRPWSPARTIAWLAGCLVLLLATSSGIGRYAPAMFSLHITSHMLTTMLAPMLLVLGGPLSLTQQAVTPAGPQDLPGPREWLGTLGSSRLVAWLTNPAVALVLFAGAPFVLYFTSLFDAAMRFHWAHQAITACFLVIGYFFAWTVIGVDELPRPLPNLGRLGMLLAAMPFDAVLAAAMMNTHRVIGNGPAGSLMYDALDLPWVPDLLADQWTAGLVALVIGELSLLVALAAVLLRWSGVDEADDASGMGSYRLLVAELSRHPQRTR